MIATCDLTRWTGTSLVAGAKANITLGVGCTYKNRADQPVEKVSAPRG